MKALKERGVGETTILGQWWCKGLFLGGKACLYQGENEEAVNCLRKGSKVRGCSCHSLLDLRCFTGCLPRLFVRAWAESTTNDWRCETQCFSIVTTQF